MKKEAFFPVLALFLVLSVSSVSADIIINQQPDELYSLGERLVIPMTITTSDGIYDFLQVSLICDGKEQKFSKDEIDIGANEAKKTEKSVLLIKKFIGDLKGTCRVKAYFETSPQDYVFSDEFKISNSINISLEENGNEFNPGELISVKGTAKKENSENVNGFLEVNLVMDSAEGTKNYYETVSNGFFSLNFSMPKDAKSGQYLVKVSVHEKDPLGEIANNGFTSYNLFVKQVPTSLEIVFENNSINPGTDLRVKSVLHDQTGERINSIAIMTVKNSNDKILEQKEVSTEEFLTFPIPYNEPPLKWTVVSVSNKITANSEFEIKQKESANVNIINRTVIITNTGNIPYNETLLVKIGNYTDNINAYLRVDESKKYTLTAPDGRYDVEIISQGELKATGSVLLAGNSIDVREVSASELIKSPILLIFITLVIGFMVFTIFRKGYRKSFFGYLPQFKKNRDEERLSKIHKEFLDNVDSEAITNPKNKAELSLSLSGNKQNASIMCLRIKNLNEISRKDSSTKDLFDRISNLVIGNRGFIYESQGNLFFLLIPSITKTFRNERKAVEISQEIEKMVLGHNKTFKQKVDFGISVNSGDIVTKKEAESLKFMALGSLTNMSKKIASLANNETYLSDTVGKRLLSEMKADKLTLQGVEVYKVRELKEKKEEHEKFIRQFMKRLESSEGKK